MPGLPLGFQLITCFLAIRSRRTHSHHGVARGEALVLDVDALKQAQRALHPRGLHQDVEQRPRLVFVEAEGREASQRDSTGRA